MQVAVATIPVHKPNEDSFLSDEELGLFGVFDGVGGYAGGGQASKIAAKFTREVVKDQTEKNKKLTARKLLEMALVLAAVGIAQDGERRRNPLQSTTATVAKIDKANITIANVGDSKCYGLTKSNKLKLLTKEHSILQELIDEKKISTTTARKINQATNAKKLTQVELGVFQQRHIITTALSAGFSQDDINFSQADLADFKTLILTTDGVHDNLTDEEIKNIVLKNDEPKKSAEKIVNAAFSVSHQNTLRSKPDDITAVVVSF